MRDLSRSIQCSITWETYSSVLMYIIRQALYIIHDASYIKDLMYLYIHMCVVYIHIYHGERSLCSTPPPQYMCVYAHAKCIQSSAVQCEPKQTATHCNTLQCTATHYNNTLQQWMSAAATSIGFFFDLLSIDCPSSFTLCGTNVSAFDQPQQSN